MQLDTCLHARRRDRLSTLLNQRSSGFFPRQSSCLRLQLMRRCWLIFYFLFFVGGFGSGLVSGGGGAHAVQERHAPTERPLRDPEQHAGGQQLRPGQREVWYALNNHPPLDGWASGIRRAPFPVYSLCVCVLAFEQPGRQLHGRAEFRDSGQGHRQPHVHHAGLRR